MLFSFCLLLSAVFSFNNFQCNYQTVFFLIIFVVNESEEKNKKKKDKEKERQISCNSLKITVFGFDNDKKRLFLACLKFTYPTYAIMEVDTAPDIVDQLDLLVEVQLLFFPHLQRQQYSSTQVLQKKFAINMYYRSFSLYQVFLRNAAKSYFTILNFF